MGCYKVNFGDYCLSHNDDTKYFNYFEFNGKKYPIGAYVNLNDRGKTDMFYDNGYDYKKGGYRLVDHYITSKGVEEWAYIIGYLHNSSIPVLHHSTTSPNELVSSVVSRELDEKIDQIGELKVEFEEPNYFPKDYEIEGLMLGWFVVALVFIGSFIFKDHLYIQAVAVFCFIKWRKNKINEAISKQKFKK